MVKSSARLGAKDTRYSIIPSGRHEYYHLGIMFHSVTSTVDSFSNHTSLPPCRYSASVKLMLFFRLSLVTFDILCCPSFAKQDFGVEDGLLIGLL